MSMSLDGLARRLKPKWLAAFVALGAGAVFLILGSAKNSQAARCAMPEGQPERPALWVIADTDTKIYLFGSVHVLSGGRASWRTPLLEDAWQASDTVFFEIDDRSLANDEVTRRIAELAKPATTAPLSARLPTATYERLKQAAKKLGLPMSALEDRDVWSISLVLATRQWAQSGLSSAQGVDATLSAEARAQPKAIRALETPVDQFAMLEGLAPADALLLLDDAIDGVLTPDQSEDCVLELAWRTGDLGALTKALEAFDSMSPESYATLVTQRNAAWTDRILQTLAEPGQFMVVVGAGHLVGPDSLIEQLSKRGQAPTRLQ